MPHSGSSKTSKEGGRPIVYGSTEVIAETPDHEKVTLKLNKLRLFSNGMFSNVYRGKIVDAKSDDPASVAVKKCWSKSDSTLTEARIFGRLHHHKHKNIVHLLYMFESHHDDRTCYGLVFEFLPSTLHTYIREMRKTFKRQLNLVEIKLLSWQLFRGQAHLANQKIIHRDIKPQNILVNPETGLLKIGDFGSSKFFNAGEMNHSYHVTRYYRAPELILKANLYGPEIDVWSCGCVLGEMLKCTVMWVGKTTENQLHLIAETLGEPTDNEIIAMKGKENSILSTSEIQEFYDRCTRNIMYNFQKLLPLAPSDAIKLISKILQYTPSERLCGPKLLANSWFKEIFDPATRRYNGKAIRILSMDDYRNAIAGDKPEAGTSATGSNTNDDENNDL